MIKPRYQSADMENKKSLFERLKDMASHAPRLDVQSVIYEYQNLLSTYGLEMKEKILKQMELRYIEGKSNLPYELVGGHIA